MKQARTTSRLLKFAIVVLAGLSSAGCITSQGPLYTVAEESENLAIQDGHCLILFYWHESMGGVKLYANDRMIARIGPGKYGFLSHPAKSGQLQISSGIGSGNFAQDVFFHGILPATTGQKGHRLTLDVVAGTKYYVRLRQGAWHETMKLMPEAVGTNEIAKCHWQNAPTSPAKPSPAR